MARILGLDIGARTVKALLLESNLRGFAVRDYHASPLPDAAALPAALAALQAGGQLAADQVVVSVPGALVGGELAAGLQLPYDLSEVVFDYQVLGKREGKSDVLVGAVKKDELLKLLEVLLAAGVDPRVVTSSALAYQSLLAAGMTGHSGAPPPGEAAEAIVDIGHERTSICIGTSGGALEYARVFSGGGRELTRAVAAEFKVTLRDAEAWKDNEGDVTLGPDVAPESEKSAAALLRGRAPIVREVRSTFRAHFARFHRPVGRVFLAGGTSRLKGLEGVFARELSAEVLKLDALPPGAPVDSAQAGAASLAFALALRGHGSARAARFNLRKAELAFKGDLDYLKGKVSRLAVFGGVLLALAVLLVFAKFQTLSKAEKELDTTLCTATQRVLGQCQKDYLVALSRLKGKGSAGAALPAYSSVDLFAEVASRAQALNVKFEDMAIQLDRVQLRGETESFDGVDQLVGALKGFKCFQEIKRGKVQKNKDGTKVTFDLDIRVQCGPEGAKAEGA